MKIEEKGDQLVVVDFNEAEAYRIACKIEKDGIEFYGKLAQAIVDKDTKRKIEFLLREEKKHLNFFEECLQEKEKRTVADPGEESLLDYMDYAIFQPYQNIKDLSDKIDDIKQALRLAVIVEDKSIKFYQACKEKVSAAEAKQELQNIIEEERRHKQLLTGI